MLAMHIKIAVNSMGPRLAFWSWLSISVSSNVAIALWSFGLLLGITSGRS